MANTALTPADQAVDEAKHALDEATNQVQAVLRFRGFKAADGAALAEVEAAIVRYFLTSQAA